MNKIIPILSFLVLFTYSLLGQTVVSIPAVTSPTGDEVLVPINATVTDLGSVNINVEYDSTVLTFVEVANNNLAGGSFVLNPHGDTLSIAWFNTTSVDIATKLLDLKFVYNGGTSAVSFVGTNQLADGLSVPINSVFTDGSVGPEPISIDLSDETGVPGDTVEVEMTAVNLEGVGAMNLYINYDDSKATFVGMGDINLAGFTANGVADRVNLGMFDANGFDHSSGVLATLKFVIIAGNTDLDFDATSFVQDVSFVNIPAIFTSGSVGEVDATMLLGDVVAFEGKEVSVSLSGLKLASIGSFNIDILYDASVLEFVRVENVVSGSLVANETSGTLSLGYFNAEGLDVLDGVIADLVFNYVSGTSAIAFDVASADVQDINFAPVSLDYTDGSVAKDPGPEDAEYPVIEAATDGTLDQPWTFNDLGAVGTIEVEDSTASAWGSHVVKYTDSGYTGLALINKVFTESYTVSSDIFLIGEQDATFPLYTGIAIKSVTEGFKYYRFVYRNSTTSMGQLKLQGYDGASWHISKTWNVGTEIDQLATGWHNFKITVEGDKFYAYMDGDLLSGSPISVTGDAAFLEKGLPGIFVYNGSGGSVTFDNFKVEENVKLEYTISEIQTPADSTGDSPLVGEYVITTGVVTGVDMDDDGNADNFFIQDGSGAYNGIFVYSEYASPKYKVAQGDSITLQGKVKEYYNKTELDYVSGLTVHASGVTEPAAVALTTDEVNDEKYEGVLVSISAANVEENNSYGEAKFDDGSGEVMTDDMLTDAFPFVLGNTYDITGVVDYSFSNYKILYRDASDIIAEQEGIMTLDHNTGNLVVSVFNNGTIGANKFESVDYGVGVEWKGTNGLWRGGPVFGASMIGEVNGQSHNNSGVGFFDLVTVKSDFTSGFFSETAGTVEFDQVSETLVSDDSAASPLGLEMIQKTYSKSGEDVVFIRYGLINSFGMPLPGVSVGLFLDYDVTPYTANSGGISASEHLAYQYAPGTSEPYFGGVAIDGMGGAIVSSSNLDTEDALRKAVLGYISNIDDTDPGTGDQRTWIGTNLGTIANGDTAWVTFAIVAGDDLHDIRYNAERAFILAKDAGFTDITVGVEENTLGLPSNYEISQNYPNPFNPATVIEYALPLQSSVKINVYNTLGQLVTKLVDADLTAGYHQVQFNASNLASGVYFYSIQAESFDGSKNFQIVKKMMLVK